MNTFCTHACVLYIYAQVSMCVYALCTHMNLLTINAWACVCVCLYICMWQHMHAYAAMQIYMHTFQGHGAYICICVHTLRYACSAHACAGLIHMNVKMCGCTCGCI